MADERTTALPKPDCFIMANIHAKEIADNAIIAFFTAGIRDRLTAEIQKEAANKVHAEFAKMADALGYTISPLSRTEGAQS